MNCISDGVFRRGTGRQRTGTEAAPSLSCRRIERSSTHFSAATSCQPAYRPSTTSILARICSRRFGANFPIRLLRYVRSTANSCDALATESFGRPATLAGKKVFPGAASHDRLLVSGTHTTVASRLRFSGLPWTTTTGRRNPGAEPDGIGRSAHQISPWATSTTRHAPKQSAPRRGQMDREAHRAGQRRGSWLP